MTFIKPKRIEFPLFNVIETGPRISMADVMKRRFYKKCPICNEDFPDILNHAIEQTDLEHIIYIIHST